MTPQELQKHIETQAAAAVQDVAQRAVQHIRNRTPQNWKRTREAATHQTRGTHSVVGLDFRQKYRTTGTRTKQHFARTWQAVRPVIVTELTTRLHNIFEG